LGDVGFSGEAFVYQDARVNAGFPKAFRHLLGT
jgi:hypothetical protein